MRRLVATVTKIAWRADQVLAEMPAPDAIDDYAGGKRRFDSYANESDAMEAAEQLAKRIDARDYVAATLTRDQAIEYANAVGRAGFL